MRTRIFAFLIPIAALVAAPAFADPAAASCPMNEDGIATCAGPRLELGARLGVGLPLGSAFHDTSLNDTVAADIPIQIDFGVRPDPHLFVGVYGQYALLAPAAGVCDGASCSGRDVRLGIEALYHFRPLRRLDPWAGVGVGYEWMHTGASRDGADREVTLRGIELANVQGGLDYAVCNGVRVGPFASLSLGKFDKASATWTVEGIEHAGSADIPNTAYHGWLTLGVRGSFDL